MSEVLPLGDMDGFGRFYEETAARLLPPALNDLRIQHGYTYSGRDRAVWLCWDDQKPFPYESLFPLPPFVTGHMPVYPGDPPRVMPWLSRVRVEGHAKLAGDPWTRLQSVEGRLREHYDALIPHLLDARNALVPLYESDRNLESMMRTTWQQLTGGASMPDEEDDDELFESARRGVRAAQLAAGPILQGAADLNAVREALEVSLVLKGEGQQANREKRFAAARAARDAGNIPSYDNGEKALLIWYCEVAECKDRTARADFESRELIGKQTQGVRYTPEHLRAIVARL